LKNLTSKFLSDPLTHFLVVGGLLFAAFTLIETPNNTRADPKVIEVDQQSLLTFLQYRSTAFEPETFANVLNSMGKEERQTLIEDYVRNEVLLREAEAIGLSRDDAVIRQRLIQRMEFAMQGLVAETQVFDEQDLTGYFEENRAFYRTEPALTFTHVFTRDEAQSGGLLAELQNGAVSPAASLEYGERFPYFTNYVDRTEDFIASHFGEEMTAALFALPVGDTTWHGPLRSALGFHLVQVTRSDPARLPELVEIRDRVITDMQRAGLDESLDRAIEALISSYDVRVDLRPDPQEN
jgi:hypothetical protein